ncbi:protein-disulfide reductase DsbD family protein [Tenacibaculum sp. IB213877]|uniref:protein-disulfide reductase DsbD family protein n=1 Tax=Tenacibaculum sp. IB213877 TaxID=3097351 RepID=UPI002A5A380D|nr:cytochrome c biogenesis protein CcdA [Tenacibaculum sp. IB213877]MDY0780316.1 cytochrome c biogenesis protein CcdA [Tenacibaculum sp. IB213877]
MKKILFLFLLLISYSSFSQVFDPVTWKTGVEKISETEYNLITTATIDRGWHLYAQKVPKGGPRPTVFTFKPNENYELVGETTEDIGITEDDKTFKMRIKYFAGKATFKQKIKLLNEKATIDAEVEFMVCDDVRCLPPRVETLSFTAPKGAASTAKTTTEATAVSNVEANRLLYGISEQDLQQPIADLVATIEQIDVNADVETKNESSSLWSIFGLGFLGGLLALLTPCVFPMIPLTVSFFTKKDSTKGAGVSKAVLYGLFILAVYLILSIPFHLLDSINPDILNEISTNIWLNIIFFVVFVFFAGSFFGFYELTLPSSWTNKTTQGESSGGLLGVFFMALTLAIVSFSCTGPILGSLLAGSLSSDGGAWQLTSGMAGFGVALGLPFTLFAMFPNMLKSLPKSGGWMNTVKVVLGFLELALAFKFLSNADLVAHWNILKIEPFLILWIVIFAGLAWYLFGIIKFPHDSPLQKISFPRIAFGVLVAAFTIYLASGFRVKEETNTFTPLSLLSGLAPPVGYSFVYPNSCPNNLTCFKDLKEGLAYAKKVNKPIMLDFTGYACVNCRKMEEHVWPIKKVDDVLRNDYVLISLYVDDKKELPKEEQIVVNRINGGTRQLTNYGHKWSHFQTVFFKTNTQPYYVLLSADGKQILNEPVGYTPNEEAYLDWLNDGKEKAGNSLDNLFNTTDLIN